MVEYAMVVVVRRSFADLIHDCSVLPVNVIQLNLHDFTDP